MYIILTSPCISYMRTVSSYATHASNGALHSGEYDCSEKNLNQRMEEFVTECME